VAGQDPEKPYSKGSSRGDAHTAGVALSCLPVPGDHDVSVLVWDMLDTAIG